MEIDEFVGFLKEAARGYRSHGGWGDVRAIGEKSKALRRVRNWLGGSERKELLEATKVDRKVRQAHRVKMPELDAEIERHERDVLSARDQANAAVSPRFQARMSAKAEASEAAAEATYARKARLREAGARIRDRRRNAKVREADAVNVRGFGGAAALLAAGIGGGTYLAARGGSESEKKAYRGDFKDLALDPKSGLMYQQRLDLLEEHHRRRSREQPEHPAMSVAKGSAKGLGYGAATIGSREFIASLREGRGIRGAAKSGLRRARSGAILGAIIGAPIGLAAGAIKNMSIWDSRKVQKMPAEARQKMLARKVDKAMGYTSPE